MEEIKFEKIPVGIFDKVKNNKDEFVEKFIDELEELFPDTVKDGKVDFQALLERFGEYKDRDERYELNWVGKSKARQEDFEDIVGRTLKYIEEDSKNPETTENLYIEGDNLEVLKLLRNSYYGKIKMIYIDPPYNTGNDFVYKDDFTMTKEEYDKLKGDINEYGKRLVKNSSDSGRYHSNWLNMMYPRLKVAKDLLADDGVIFISIDDNEVHNIRSICDEIFKEKNFVAEFVWVKKNKGSHLSKTIRNMTEYIICYSKNKIMLELFGEQAYSDKKQPLAKRTNAIKKLKFDKNVIMTTLNDGTYKKGEYGKGTSSIKFLENFKIEEGIVVTSITVEGPFIWIQETLDNEIKKGSEVHLSSMFGFNVLRYNQNEKIKRPTTIMNKEINIGTNEDAYSELNKLMNAEGIMDYPKPVSLLKYVVNTKTYFDKDSIILDFFSGSATTAHAVMDLNAEDGGNRKFIMVQLPEPTDKESEAFKKGYKDICEIGKERIRRAGRKIIEDNKDKESIESLDTGFKVLRVDDTNFRRIKEVKNKNITFKYKSLSVKDEEDFNPNFTDLDIVYELMLRRQDIQLTEEIKKLDNIGERTYVVGDTILVCLEENVTGEIVEQIGKIETDLSWIVLRDSAFDDDCDLKINTTRKLRSIIKASKEKEQKLYWI